MNENGDERIDHDEWLPYMLNLMIGSFDQRAFLVFNVYDIDRTGLLKPEYMKLFLRHIPIYVQGKKYGITYDDCIEAHLKPIAIFKEK